MSTDLSHTQIIMWIVGFFFVGVGATSFVFKMIAGGLSKSFQQAMMEIKTFEGNVNSDIHAIDKQFKSVETKIDLGLQVLEHKKLDVELYVKDEAAARILIEKLQTREACEMMQHGCQVGITDKLSRINKALDTVIENQSKFHETVGEMTAYRKRVDHCIERIDGHMNGHNHKEIK